MIIIDGAEKVGKSTLCRELEKLGYEVRHWGKVKTDAEYTPELKRAIDRCYNDQAKIVWDRCWPSEAVYGKLLGRTDHRLSNDWWLGAFLHERAVDAIGVKVMMLGPNDQTLEARRTPDDLPVDVHAERSAFYRYAKVFPNWAVYRQNVGAWEAEWIAGTDQVTMTDAVAHPKDCCGPQDARVLVLGEAGSKHPPKVPGQWLVFTTPYMIEFARKLGNFALSCRWTNVDVVRPEMLSGIGTIVTLGQEAQTWAHHYGGKREIISRQHPAYVWRWNSADKTQYDDLPALLARRI